MFVRAIALFLAVLIGIGTIIPIATQQAQAETGPKKHRKYAKHYKKYSKGWWRQYRARMKRKRAMQAAKRALRLRQLRLAKANAAANPASQGNPAKPALAKAKKADVSAPVVSPSDEQVGSAAISVVGPAMQTEGESSRSKSVGGMPTTSLRRGVIDRMIRENGWVVNDYVKEIAGQQVYVVVAQSQAKNGGVQSQMFYFTEVDGRIYSVVTNSPVQEAERLASESEKVINSLKSRVNSTQRASVKQ